MNQSQLEQTKAANGDMDLTTLIHFHQKQLRSLRKQAGHEQRQARKTEKMAARTMRKEQTKLLRKNLLHRDTAMIKVDTTGCDADGFRHEVAPPPQSEITQSSLIFWWD